MYFTLYLNILILKNQPHDYCLLRLKSEVGSPNNLISLLQVNLFFCTFKNIKCFFRNDAVNLCILALQLKAV